MSVSVETIVVLPEQVERVLARADLVEAVEQALISEAEERGVMPPPGELLFPDANGEAHIKYGYVKGGRFFVVKVATGYFNNPKRGLPSSNGAVLVFDAETGAPAAVLLDRGRLTDARTGAAGAVAAKHLAPSKIERIAVYGAGIQAGEQLRWLAKVQPCRRVLAWNRRHAALDRLVSEMAQLGYDVETTHDRDLPPASCNLIVTATAAAEPVLRSDAVRPGTHITAVGADSPHKQELDVAILARAQIVAADSIRQCCERGEIAHGVKSGVLRREQITSLGAIVSGREKGRLNESDITVADLTGLALQDLFAASAVLETIQR